MRRWTSPLAWMTLAAVAYAAGAPLPADATPSEDGSCVFVVPLFAEIADETIRGRRIVIDLLESEGRHLSAEWSKERSGLRVDELLSFRGKVSFETVGKRARMEVRFAPSGQYRAIARAFLGDDVVRFSEAFTARIAPGAPESSVVWHGERETAILRPTLSMGSERLRADFRALVGGAPAGAWDERSLGDAQLVVPARRDVVLEIPRFAGSPGLGVPVPQTVRARPGATLDVDFRLPPGVETVVWGRHPDGSLRKGTFAHTRLVRWPDRAAPCPCRTTGRESAEDLRLEIPPGRIGIHLHTVSAEGEELLGWSELIVEATREGPQIVEVPLRADGAVLRATILDDRSEPFARKPLWIHPYGPRDPADEVCWSGRTDAQGEVTSPPLPPADYVVEVGSAPDARWKRVSLRGSGDPPVVWRLPSTVPTTEVSVLVAAPVRGSAEDQSPLARRVDREEEWGRVGWIPDSRGKPFGWGGRGAIRLPDGEWTIELLPTWGGGATGGGIAHRGARGRCVVPAPKDSTEDGFRLTVEPR